MGKNNLESAIDYAIIAALIIGFVWLIGLVNGL